MGKKVSDRHIFQNRQHAPAQKFQAANFFMGGYHSLLERVWLLGGHSCSQKVSTWTSKSHDDKYGMAT